MKVLLGHEASKSHLFGYVSILLYKKFHLFRCTTISLEFTKKRVWSTLFWQLFFPIPQWQKKLSFSFLSLSSSLVFLLLASYFFLSLFLRFFFHPFLSLVPFPQSLFFFKKKEISFLFPFTNPHKIRFLHQIKMQQNSYHHSYIKFSFLFTFTNPRKKLYNIHFIDHKRFALIVFFHLA